MDTTADVPAATEMPSYSAEVKRRVLVATIIGQAMVFLDTGVLTLALPKIQAQLGLDTAQVQWVASGFLLTLSVLLLIGGRLSDLFGRRRMFHIGLMVYGALGIAAALSPTGQALIAVRVLQGAAGAILVPTTLALINATYPPEERGTAIGLWAGWSGIATLIGPIIGGFVIDRFSWRLVFLFAPLLAVVTLLIGWNIPESRDETASRHIDYLGIVLVTFGLTGLVFPLIQGPVSGWGSPIIWGSAVVGAALLVGFVVHEARARSPMLPFGMFEDRNLAVANIVTLFVYAGLYGTFFYVSLYLQLSLGVAAVLVGALYIPNVILLFFLSPVAGRLNDRFGPRWLLCGGPLLASVGLAIVSFTGPGQEFTILVPGLIVFGVGLGFTVAPVTATAIGAAPQRYSGVASGFNNAVSRFAGLIAIAMMGVIVVALWQSGLAAASIGTTTAIRVSLDSVRDRAFVLPSGTALTPEQTVEAKARAVAAARSAFHDGMLLAALLVAIGGIVAGVGITNRQPRAGRAPPR